MSCKDFVKTVDEIFVTVNDDLTIEYARCNLNRRQEGAGLGVGFLRRLL